MQRKKNREIGTLPEEFETYQNQELKQLLENLHETKKRLKNYTHVNQKATDQYNNFIDQRQKLGERFDELKVN